MTVQTLQEVGIRAQRGFPSGKMPYLTEPVAGVSVGEVKDGAVTAVVRIYAPASRGAVACEDTAALAMQSLSLLQAQCSMGSCEFDGKSGLFCLPLRATFVQMDPTPSFEVYIDAQRVANVVNVTTGYHAKLERGEANGLNSSNTSVTDRYWVVQMEELMPVDEVSEYLRDSFTLQIHHSSTIEQYRLCYCQTVSTESTPAGIRRVRQMCTSVPPETLKKK